MRNAKAVKATIRSEKGFYIGDVCAVLDDGIYTNIWGRIGGYLDGEYRVDNGLRFAVGSTANGSGVYMDDNGNIYAVGSGVIGLIPLELVTDWETAAAYGQVVQGVQEATMDENGGDFVFVLSSNRIHIET